MRSLNLDPLEEALTCAEIRDTAAIFLHSLLPSRQGVAVELHPVTVTTVKPKGTVSTLKSSASGSHFQFNSSYRRRQISPPDQQ